MSVGHSEASFNHSCLKVPVDSSSRQIFSKYERVSSADNSGKDQQLPKSAYYSNFQSIRSYLKFYESIPDYTELHHLSNEEFYSQLKSLKITQKKFHEESRTSECYTGPFDLYACDRTEARKVKRGERNFCCSAYSTSTLPDKGWNARKELVEERGKNSVISDNENMSELYECEFKKHSDYEADQESSTLQLGGKSKKNCKDYLFTRGDYLASCCTKRTRSLPLSSGCECEIPETNLRNDHCRRDFTSSYCGTFQNTLLRKKSPQRVQSLPIPLTSRIPLYDRMMEEKEARRKAIHERYSEKLRSLVQPFSFTKREEQSKRLRMVRSNPELSSSNIPTVRFKAKPIPKHLFSNYAYEKMREDEFYRALKRRVRAEELLKSSSLPPSMALRERKYLSKSLEYLDGGKRSVEKTWDVERGYRRACKDLRRSIELDERNKAKTPNKKNLAWLLNKSRRVNSTTDSSAEISPYESVLSDSRRKTRPHSAYSSSRSNLASVLRIETARKRLEREMEEKLMESRLKCEARLKARLVRMSPEWRALNFDKDGDLALRLATRREEERMRQERHHKSMESMYGRVYRMPPLFHRGNNSKKRPSVKSGNEAVPEDREETKQPETNSNASGVPKPLGLDDSGRYRRNEGITIKETN